MIQVVVKRIAAGLVLGSAIFSTAAVSGTLQGNIENGMGLRSAVVDAHASSQLTASAVIEAMSQNRKAASLIFLYAVEAAPDLLSSLLTDLPASLEGAVIDAVLVAVKHDLPILYPILTALAVTNVPLGKEVIYAVTEVFPERAKQIFDVLVATNNEATEAFEDSYTDALAAMESEGTQNGDLYEAYEPEGDVSPA